LGGNELFRIIIKSGGMEVEPCDLWLPWVFVAVHRLFNAACGLSLLAVSRAGYSQDAALGILAVVASLVTEHGLWSGPSRCGTWA